MLLILLLLLGGFTKLLTFDKAVALLSIGLKATLLIYFLCLFRWWWRTDGQKLRMLWQMLQMLHPMVAVPKQTVFCGQQFRLWDGQFSLHCSQCDCPVHGLSWNVQDIWRSPWRSQCGKYTYEIYICWIKKLCSWYWKNTALWPHLKLLFLDFFFSAPLRIQPFLYITQF